MPRRWPGWSNSARAIYGLAAAAGGSSLLERIRRITELSGSRGKSWAGWTSGLVTILLVLAILSGVRMRQVGADEPSRGGLSGDPPVWQRTTTSR